MEAHPRAQKIDKARQKKSRPRRLYRREGTKRLAEGAAVRPRTPPGSTKRSVDSIRGGVELRERPADFDARRGDVNDRTGLKSKRPVGFGGAAVDLGGATVRHGDRSAEINERSCSIDRRIVVPSKGNGRS
jgi:hypothetical protein